MLERVVASSWLHQDLNVSEQALEPLLANGWNLVVQAALRAVAPPPPPPNFGNPQPPVISLEYVSVSDDDKSLHVHWGQMASYSIWVPETISVVIPAAASRSDNDLVASPPLIIWATKGTITPRGPIVEHNFETTIKQAASVLELTLDGDMWAPEIGHVYCDECPAEKSLPGSDGGRKRVMTPQGRPPPAGCPCLPGDMTARYVPHHANATFNLLAALIASSERDELAAGATRWRRSSTTATASCRCSGESTTTCST